MPHNIFASASTAYFFRDCPARSFCCLIPSHIEMMTYGHVMLAAMPVRSLASSVDTYTFSYISLLRSARYIEPAPAGFRRLFVVSFIFSLRACATHTRRIAMAERSMTLLAAAFALAGHFYSPHFHAHEAHARAAAFRLAKSAGAVRRPAK